ncbi:hypothetical protein G3R41_08760 [Modestobacter muralis]|uniref:Uncharacterized protein n=1 Tax=Modestobacter muralis TaxID=1608614 RepID=A0A6P0H5F4_9ACTN|nr:hypothetical protein [Modestobacter muralis]NEN51030.1 hypothetical protein [Modestobacter muralis]
MIDSSGTRTPAQPQTDDDVVSRLRAGYGIPVGPLSLTAEPDGSLFTLTDQAGNARTFRSLDELDDAVTAARAAAWNHPPVPVGTPPAEPPTYVPAPVQDEPAWCVDHERIDEGHVEDKATVHRGVQVDVVTDAWQYAVRTYRYDFDLLPEGAQPEDPMVMVDDQCLTPAEALALGTALVSAARQLGVAEHPFDPVASEAAPCGFRTALPVPGGRNTRS